MNSRHARAILAHAAAVAGANPVAVADGDLLKRFAKERDEAAFAELVRRYGRLVWAVCRQLLPSDADADDAFQATFLVLVRSPGGVRDGCRLGPWLHGVAYRVCLKSKRAVARTKRRETVVARPEAGQPVPDAAWDDALRAVHEEVNSLPTSLRVPFVLCCLEGKAVAEAAAQLGWKLGTLSGRLTRAKQSIIARLTERGLGAGAVAAVAVTAGVASGGAPAPLVARTVGLLQTGAVPSTVLQLSQGVLAMNVNRIKLLAAALFVATGLALTGGSSWLANAGAQTPDVRKEVLELVVAADPKPTPKPDDKNKVEAGEQLKLEITLTDANAASKWEFQYHPQFVGYGMKKSEFEGMVQDLEKDGWQFVGVLNMKWESTLGGEPKDKGGVTLPTLVFKRPTKAALSREAAGKVQLYEKLMQADKAQAEKRAADAAQQEKRKAVELLHEQAAKLQERDHAARIRELEAMIAELKAQLATGKEQPRAAKAPEVSRLLGVDPTLPLDPKALTELIQKLAERKFGPSSDFAIVVHKPGVLQLSGTAAAVDWAAAMIAKLTEK